MSSGHSHAVPKMQKTVVLLRALVLSALLVQAWSAKLHSDLLRSVRVTELDVEQSSIDATSKSLSSVLSSVLDAAKRSDSGGLSKDGDSYGGDGLTFEALKGKAEYTVILLHGLSAKVEQVAPIVTLGQLSGLTSTRFILPQAPDAYVNYRRRTEPSWYNIDSTTAGAKEHEDDIMEAAGRIDKIIAGEHRRGIPEGNVAIVGLSQGGGVALTVYMRSREKLAGVVGLSTYLPLASSYPDAQSSTNKDVPLLMVHGSADDVVEIEWARMSAEKIRDSGRQIDLKVIEGAPHIFGTSFAKAAEYSIEYLKDRGIR